jgi:hypothetical protein
MTPNDPMIPDRRSRRRPWRRKVEPSPIHIGFADLTRPYDWTKLEAEMLLAPDSIERTVALLAIHELKQTRTVLKAMRDAHADVQFDTPEDTAVQAKAVALANSILARAN